MMEEFNKEIVRKIIFITNKEFMIAFDKAIKEAIKDYKVQKSGK